MTLGSKREERPLNGGYTLSEFENRISRTAICRKLESIHRDLALLGEQGKIGGFFNNVENTDKLSGLVEDVRDTVMDYQVRAPNNPLFRWLISFQTSLQQDIYERSFLLIVSLIPSPLPLRLGG